MATNNSDDDKEQESESDDDKTSGDNDSEGTYRRDDPAWKGFKVLKPKK